MTLKCSRCNQEIGTVFLEKIRGTIVRESGKKRAICSACQRASARQAP